MKFKKALLVISSILLISSCGPTSNPTTTPSVDPTSQTSTTPTDRKLSHKIVNYYYPDLESNVVRAEAPLFFEEGSDIPFMSMTDITFVMNQTFSLVNGLDLQIFSVETKDGKSTIKHNYFETTCVVDVTTNTITFDDFSKFTSPDYNSPFTLSNNVKREGQYTTGDPTVTGADLIYNKGEPTVIDLNKFETIKVIEDVGELYIPLHVINAVFLGTTAYHTLAYNFKDIFLLGFSEAVSVLSDTPGELLQIYEGEAEIIDKLSTSYTKYNYETLVLTLENNWGNTGRFGEIKDFDAWLEENNFKAKILSGYPHKIDEAMFSIFRGKLYDGHSNFLFCSPFSDEDKINYDRTVLSEKGIELNEYIGKYTETRINTIGKADGIEVYEDTLVFMWNEFSDQGVIDLETPIDESYLSGTTIQRFLYLRDYLENHDEIKNIVFDVALNTGGSTETLNFALASIVGEFEIQLRDPVTGTTTRQVIKGDVNCDGVYDEKDVSFEEMGYNIGLSLSRVSFSCGNAFTYYLKNTGKNVATFGEQGGGGTCCVYNTITPSGSYINLSGRLQFNEFKNDEYNDLEDGLIPESSVEFADLCNAEKMNQLMNEYFSK